MQFFLSDHLDLTENKDFQNGDMFKNCYSLESSKCILFATDSTKGGGPLNLSGFRLIRFDSVVNKPYKLIIMLDETRQI